MANTPLTSTKVLRKALVVLHQKLNFIGACNRTYDESYAKQGAKIGDTLKIRLPNQYSVSTGRNLDVQETVESSVDLTIATQKHVDMYFTSDELTLDIDDFNERIIDPAMSVLAANIEADAMSMYKDIYWQVANIDSAITWKDILKGGRKLNEALTPQGKRYCNLSDVDRVELVDALKGLFHDAEEIAAQYRDGMLGRTGGFDFYMNTLWPSHTTGTDASAYLINGASQTGATLTVDTGTGTMKKGDIITLAGVNKVHPESKTDMNELQQFVVTADVAASATSIPISPSIVTSGVSQNVTGSPADNAVITKAGGNAAVHSISMAHHRDAFAFATADLVMPKGVDFAAREALDGISMRIVRQYAINSDTFPCRIDVLYGYKTVRAQLACRLAFN